MLPQHNTEGPSVAFPQICVGVIPPSPTDTTSEEKDNYLIIRDEENAGDGEEFQSVLGSYITAISTERTESAPPTASKLMDGYTLPSDEQATVSRDGYHFPSNQTDDPPEDHYIKPDHCERDIGAIQTSSSSIAFENDIHINPEKNSVYRLPLAPPAPCRPMTSLNSQNTKEETPYNMTFTLIEKQDEEYSLPVKRRMDKRIVLLCVALCGVALIAVAAPLGVFLSLKELQTATEQTTIQTVTPPKSMEQTSTSTEQTTIQTVTPPISTEQTSSSTEQTTIQTVTPPISTEQTPITRITSKISMTRTTTRLVTSTEFAVTQSTTPTTTPEHTLTTTMPPQTSTEPTGPFRCHSCHCFNITDRCPSNGKIYDADKCRQFENCTKGCVSYIKNRQAHRSCADKQSEDEFKHWRGLDLGCHNTSHGYVCLCKGNYCNTDDMTKYKIDWDPHCLLTRDINDEKSRC